MELSEQQKSSHKCSIDTSIDEIVRKQGVKRKYTTDISESDLCNPTKHTHKHYADVHENNATSSICLSCRVQLPFGKLIKFYESNYNMIHPVVIEALAFYDGIQSNSIMICKACHRHLAGPNPSMPVLPLKGHCKCVFCMKEVLRCSSVEYNSAIYNCPDVKLPTIDISLESTACICRKCNSSLLRKSLVECRNCGKSIR